MKYGDFSSVVQLGVGLHVGTVVLQLYGDIGLQPLNRALARLRSLFLAPEHERPPKEFEDELLGIEAGTKSSEFACRGSSRSTF